MSGHDDNGRLVLKAEDAGFQPYDLYGDPVPGIVWKPINFDRDAARGSFLVRLDPGSKSLPHIHTGGEDSYILEGELIDGDGRAYGPGEIISYAAGSRHASRSPKGCTILVFLHGPNRALAVGETV
jgi:anti-sigma factor ChrR (cupin superfamily)